MSKEEGQRFQVYEVVEHKKENRDGEGEFSLGQTASEKSTRLTGFDWVTPRIDRGGRRRYEWVDRVQNFYGTRGSRRWGRKTQRYLALVTPGSSFFNLFYPSVLP